MMTFYLGKDYNVYKNKFDDLKEYFMKRANETSNAGIFRFLIDVLHDDLERRKKENKEE